MRELRTMWGSTRMVVLTAVSAACYVATLLPFKLAVILPGLTEARPGAAVPILLSFLFGPAAAFGAAIGNLIADLLGGMFGPGSLFGLLGNFLYGYLPYSLWRAWAGTARPGARGGRDWAVVSVIVIVSSCAIAAVIGWGTDMLGLAPFAAIANIIFINNVLASLLLAVPLLALTYTRVQGTGLVWHEVMDQADQSRSRFARVGAILTVIAAPVALAAGNVISLSYLGVGFGAAGFGGATGTLAVGAGLAPFLAALAVGCALL